MIDKEKGLIQKKDTIFNKISNFFKTIFYSFNKKIVIEENVNANDNDSIIFSNETKLEINENRTTKSNRFLEIYLEDCIEDIDDNYEYNYTKIQTTENDKKNFFKLYENVKNRNIDMNYLGGNDLVRINLMLKEEISLKSNGNSDNNL